MDRLVRQRITEIVAGEDINQETNNLATKPLIVDVTEVLKTKVYAGEITAPVTRESLINIINEVSLGRKSKAASAINIVNQQENVQPVIKPESTDYSGINTPIAVGNNLIDPAEFVKRLKLEVLAGVTEAQHLWNFLLTANFRPFIELLRSFPLSRQNKEYLMAIYSMRGEAWVNKVIKLVGQASGES